MAPDQCPEDAVPSVSHYTAILWVCIISGPRIMGIPEKMILDIIVGGPNWVVR